MITRWPNPIGRLIHSRRWRAGLRDECDFWRTWLTRRGGKWPADYNYRMDRESQLQPHLARLLPDDPDLSQRSAIDILDVGAGPLTIVGKRLGERTISVTAIDPLAPAYNALIDELAIKPPVRTQHGEGERLVENFGTDRFDMVISVNAVDHTRDPLLVIRQMLAVARPSAAIVLEHTANEGENNAYAGLHQWNFAVDNGHLMLRSSKGASINISQAVDDLAETTCGERLGRLFVTMRKRPR